MSRFHYRLFGLLLALAPAMTPAQHQHEPPKVLAPGYSPLEFTPPEPGSYELPALGPAADGSVVTSSGDELELHELMGDKLVVLSFIYTRCGDVNGCPLATFVLARLQEKIADDPLLAGKVRLVSMSFDPGHDTPGVLQDYSRPFRRDGFDWRFLSTRSAGALSPILDAYGQFVIRDYDEQGRDLGTISHLLRVFLIDRERRIRNIYSVSYLHADTVRNDLRTLLLEDDLRETGGR